MPEWLSATLHVLLYLLPFGLWCAWWLFCVNWKKTWPVLAGGGWGPVVLLMIMSALAWSRISAHPNFLWQLLGVTGLTLAALFCGWVQDRLGWTPPEVNFDPPAPDHGHGGHAHAGHH